MEAIDSLVLVLSTDWFDPFWDLVGIDCEGYQRDSVRKGCRDIVPQILSGADEYFLVSFSESRKGETRGLLHSLIKEHDLKEAAQLAIQEWLNATDDQLKAAWVCYDLTSDVLSGRVDEGEPQLDSKAIDFLRLERKKYLLEPFELAKICRLSNTQWDVYTKRLTPEQPTTLADSLAAVLRARRVKEMWHSARQHLSPTERQHMISWYRTIARQRCRREPLVD